MTQNEIGQTNLRIRAGDVHSVASLQKALEMAMPFASTRVTESYVDGTLEAELLVLSSAQEKAHARLCVSQKRIFRYWLLASCVCLLAGFVEWYAGIIILQHASLAKDEV